ncbi:hypothetical protein Poli38472_003268 [Pythium oligandrum]|uniref:WW domain-containing protein n=1 Tax=Pythium oligandrum TaxID=41045 RepID=A0A8K1FG11_PYTOL|nr:hypothetical protein Poli38472_003268 [Pythium oligandrum]|eukprot:TMW57343.1 hypothetical protein Poli38472_003268 [Pythium oligandrum]
MKDTPVSIAVLPSPSRHDTTYRGNDRDEDGYVLVSSSSRGGVHGSPHKFKRPRSPSIQQLPPLSSPALSLEDRQSRQMRSFLQNFLADDTSGRFHNVLDLHQHAIDTGITVTDATVQEVVNTVPNVRGLRLSQCSAITDAGLWAIARQCQSLDTIYLAGCEKITELGLRLLAHNCRLLTIGLSDCPQVNDTMLQTLAAGSWMLQTFIIQRSRRISDAGIVKLAQCCKDLRHLDVSECEHIGEYGDKALVEIGRYCPQLRVLDLFGCRHVHDVGLKAIAKGCPLLTTLKLTGCHGVSSAALRALATQCHDLQVLSLAGCGKTTNDDLTELARNCPPLEWLDISGSPNIDAVGVRALAQHCQALAYLNLSQCPRVSDAALLELATGTSSRQCLTHLVLCQCPRVTERGIDALTAACPNLLTLDLTDCEQIGRRFLQRLVQRLLFVEWAATFFGYQPLPNAAELCRQRDRRLLEERSAVKIQALMRGCLARGGVWQAKLRYVERKTLPKIQGRIRGFLVRKRLAFAKQQRRERQAALRIAKEYQNWCLRRRLARYRRVLRIQRNEGAAALIFQKVFRGHRDRQRVQRMRDETRRQKQLEARIHTMLELAAIKVQRAYRGHRGRSDAAMVRAAREANRLQAEREQHAAMFLQRVCRGHQGRHAHARRIAELLLARQKEEGAVRMQKVFRGHRARRHAVILRQEALELKRVNAAMTIQRYWRGLKDKHLAAVLIGLIKLREKEQIAARMIQNAYRIHASRGFMRAMRLAQQLQRRRLHAAITLQRLYRGHRGRTKTEVQRELQKLEVVARPLFTKQTRLAALVNDLGDRVASLERQIKEDEDDETKLTLELEKTMQIKTKYHDSSRITGTPQRYLTQYLQVQLADRLRAKRMELAMANRALETLLTQFNDAQKQLRAVKRELEPLTDGVVRKTRENRTTHLQVQVRRERVAATTIQRVFRGYRVRSAVREGANCWIEGVTDGRVYYYNTFTGESRWNKPLAMSIFQDSFLQPLAPDHNASEKKPLAFDRTSSWYEAYDDALGQSYYYNTRTKEYQWDRPELTTAFQTDTQSARKRREWLEDQQDEDNGLTLLENSTLKSQLGEWEHRLDPLSEFAFFYHPPRGEFRVSLSPRTVHKTLRPPEETASSSSRASGRIRSARSVTTSTPRSMEWQYRYGFKYDDAGQLVSYPGNTDERPVWTEHTDEEQGRTYYYNHVTQEYRWEKPPEYGMHFETFSTTTNASRAWFQKTLAEEQADNTVGEEGGSTSSPSSTRSSGRSMTARARKSRALGKKWVEYVDEATGYTYYYNPLTGETKWSLSPRTARDSQDRPDEIPLALFEKVQRLRENPVVYDGRETHMEWLETAMVEKDWAKVDAVVHQILIREESQRVEDEKAKEAADLPGGWTVHKDESTGQQYYYHAVTGITSWTRPHSEDASIQDTNAQILYSSDWIAAIDETGRSYYYNQLTSETAWTLPSS